MTTSTRADEAMVSLDLSATVDDHILTATYRVRNNGPKSVYLLNTLWEFAGSQIVKASIPAYVALNEDGFVHIAKQVPPLPRTRLVELRIIPYAQKLRFGETAEETMKFSLPLEENNPYFKANKQSTYSEVKASGMLFILQFVPELDGLEIRSSSLPGAYVLSHPALLNSIETVRSQAKPLAITVRKRLDTFERF